MRRRFRPPCRDWWTSSPPICGKYARRSCAAAPARTACAKSSSHVPISRPPQPASPTSSSPKSSCNEESAMSGEDDDLAAAWGAALEQEGDAPEPEISADAARVLNQAEIDSLLGFEDDGEGGNASKTGIERMIHSGLV